MEILIHIGVDTVKMEGKGFKTLVKENDKVTERTAAGDLRPGYN